MSLSFFGVGLLSEESGTLVATEFPTVGLYRLSRKLPANGRSLVLDADEAVVDGVEDELEAVGDAELGVDAGEVVLDGGFADAEFVGDFLVA